jgi:hypothetical protein
MHPIGIAREATSCKVTRWLAGVLAALLIMVASATAQTCLAGDEIDAATRGGLEKAGHQYFNWTATGDVASMRQNAIPAVASDFSGIETAVKDNQSNFAGTQATVRPPFLLQVDGKETLARAEFLCGVFGKTGQTSTSAVFVIPSLPPGEYAVVILDVAAKTPTTLSLVLQKAGTEWKLGGYHARPSQVGGHDSAWFLERARAFKAKGQNHNAWLYYMKARELMAPVPFMSTMQTDKVYDESQSLQLSDSPSTETPMEIAGAGKVYRFTSIFPVGIGGDLDLVVKYQSPSVANTAQTYQDNLAAIRALVAKYPEYREGFAAIIARAVEPSGRDYGTMLAVKDIK